MDASGRARGGFFDRSSSGNPPPPLADGCLFDPWGKQYSIVFDATGDERIDLVGYYSDFVGNNPGSGKAPRTRAGAFSLGPDEALGTKGNKVFHDAEKGLDDVASWKSH